MKISIYVIHNGSAPQLSRTLESLHAQTLAPWEVRVLPAADFWPASRNQLPFTGDYVLYLYSGAILAETAVADLSQAARSGAGWYYFDETIWDAPGRTLRHPDFAPLSFAGQGSRGEGLLFSRATLEAMTLRYEGGNVCAALTEMTIAAACQSDGVPLRMSLLSRFLRKPLTERECALLNAALLLFLNNRTQGILGIGKGDAPGLYLYPQPSQKAVSFLLLSEETPLPAALYPGAQILRASRGDTYLSACLQAARDASGDLLCVIGPGCALPTQEDLAKLAAYASLPGSGLVSPCLYRQDTVQYAGSFSTAGLPAQVKRDDSGCWQDIYCIRETGFPAWQFWMADRNLILELAQSMACLPELSPNYAAMELAFQAQAHRRASLYVGEVLLRWEGSQPSGKGFAYMLHRWKDRFFLDPWCPAALHAQLRKTALKDVSASFPPKMEAPAPHKRSVLILSHELSLTGAPVVLAQAIPVLKEAGWQITVAAPQDGVLKDTFLREQVPVLVLGDMDINTGWLSYAASFDLILVNTIVPFRQVQQLESLGVPILWWLHDARSGYEAYLRHVLPETFGDTVHIYSVSHYADKALHAYRPKYRTGLLRYGLREPENLTSLELPVDTQGKKLFVCVGTVIPRKGQDILAQAIRLLPRELLAQCLFLFVGKVLDPDIFRHVENVMADYPQSVQYLECIPHEEVFSLYRQADAVICTSRDDPLPTFMAETMMVSGVCICSENTGMAGILEHGRSGYLYPNDDPQSLAQCIRLVAERSHSTDIRQNARNRFLEVFPMEVFRKNLLDCVSECIGETDNG